MRLMPKGKRVVNLVSAGGVVYRRDGHRLEVVLCGRESRSAGGPHADGCLALWALPKGTPDPGETREETALREVVEETGLQVRTEAFLGTIDYWFVRPSDGARCHKTVYYYLMTAVGGDLGLHDDEFDDVRWFAPDDALKAMTYENEANIVEKSIPLASKESSPG